MSAGQPEGSRFYGKYRAVVTQNNDPDGLGRIKAKVRAFNDEETAWALPALPFAGPGVGLYLIPPEKANVWIEYEEGLRWKPVWTGCFWLDSPVDPDRLPGAKPEVKVLKTTAATITVDDDQEAVSVETTKDGKVVSITSGTVEVTNGQARVKLSAKTVSINDGGLEVT
jgi:uncharacterized protein involved in type VI secretion and phage assembly